MTNDQQIKYQREAEAAGMFFIGVTRPGYAAYRFTECGCLVERQLVNVRRKSAGCKVHGKRGRDKNSTLYAVYITTREGETYLKVGFTRSLIRRIPQWGIAEGGTHTVLGEWEFSSAHESRLLESLIHSKFKDLRIPPEIGHSVLTLNGGTELFDARIARRVVKICNRIWGDMGVKQAKEEIDPLWDQETDTDYSRLSILQWMATRGICKDTAAA